MERWARAVLRHRRAVGLLWLLLLLCGGATAGTAAERLSFDFSLPGQPGQLAEERLLREYGVTTFDTVVPVLTAPEGSTIEQERPAVERVLEQVRAALPQLRVVDGLGAGDRSFLTDDGRSTFVLVQGPMPEDLGPGAEGLLTPVMSAAAEQAGLEYGVTSYALLSSGGDVEGPSVLAETLLGGLGALAVLLFVFASFLALVPLVIATVSILTTFLLVLGLTYLTDVSFVVQFLVALVGLGVAIDYSLLLVSRWREERGHGRSNDEAVVVALQTAGHSVLASGVTVAVSLVALLVVPVPFLQSMGLGGMLIPLVSVAVVLSLLPALLSSIGPRVDWPRIRHDAVVARGWSAWGRLIVRRRWAATAVALLLLGLLIAPVFSLKIGQAGTDSLARSGPAFEVLQQLEAGGVTNGVLTPVEVVVPSADGPAAARLAADVPGIATALVGSDNGSTAVVTALPVEETVDSDGSALVEAVREAVEAGTAGEVGVTGMGAVVSDYFSAVYANFPYVLALISVITFLLLVRTFRSVLLPLKAVLLNLLSLAAVFGSIVFFWQQGHGSGALFDVSPTGAVSFWLPVLIFAFLFGLSMDYEVFILARMREEYDACGSTSEAVVSGLGRTGRLVTSAALILFFSFGALASAPGTEIKMLGTALGVGILLDATLVRALLVPALVSLFGAYNWWLPAGLARALRVEPSPLVWQPPTDAVTLRPPTQRTAHGELRRDPSGQH